MYPENVVKYPLAQLEKDQMAFVFNEQRASLMLRTFAPLTYGIWPWSYPQLATNMSSRG